jgi:hypothetical protein
MFGRNPKTFGVLAVTQEWVQVHRKVLPEYIGWLGTNKFFWELPKNLKNASLPCRKSE